MANKLYFQHRLSQIKEQVQITDIAEEFGLTVTKRDSPLASLKEHDSVIIYTETNSFFRFATGVGGDVLAFMKHIPEINMEFKEAYKYCLGKIDFQKAPTIMPRQKDTVQKVVNTRSSVETENAILEQCHFEPKTSNVIAYLIQERKIDPDIVYDHLNKKLLRQEKNDRGYRSCVFLGRDENGHVVAACKRACSANSKFKQECVGNNYDYGWLYDPEVDTVKGKGRYNPKKPLICFESEIEKMSFMTLLKMKGEDINQYTYLSTGSATKYMSIIKTVERLRYKNVIIAYNDDFGKELNAGQLNAERAKEILRLEHDIEAKILKPEEGINDWNDELKKTVAEKESPSRDTFEKERDVRMEQKVLTM